MTRTAEDEARRYLRLFPLWMRADRGEEVLGLTLDQLPPATTHLPLRARVDLVRAGLHARRRGTPPLRVWNRIVFVPAWRSDPVVPVEWRAWLASAVMTRWITVVYALLRFSFLWVYLVMGLILPRSDGEGLPMWTVGPILWVAFSAGCWIFTRERWRSRVLAANGFDQQGRPLPPGQMGYGWSRQSVPNTWVVPALAGFAVVGGVYGPAAWFQADRYDHRPTVAASAVALVLVAVVLAAALRRLDRVAARPAVMGMVVKADRTRCALSAASGAGVGVGWAWVVAMAADLFGFHLVVAFVGPLAAVAMVVAVLRTERRIGRRIGEWDLHPKWAPQLVERPIDHLPAPPGGPSTPALG
jgi:hypothetical protein